MMRTRIALAALLLAMTTAGCGKELVAGGQKHVDAAGTGDGTPEGSASKAPAYDLVPGGDSPLAAARAQGTVTFTAKVEVATAGGAYVPLSSAPATVVVKIDGSDSVHVAAGNVPAGSYTRVRVTFTGVQANVTGGLVIGGVGVTGLVSVGAAGESVIVERAVSLGSPSADVRLLIDLDASAWLGTANPVTKVVASSTFQGAVKIRTY
jgi:hypothetical protein